MIRVNPAPEPSDFDRRVRQRGLDAIAELIGQTPSKRRPGRRRTPVANVPQDIPGDTFPSFWCDMLPELRRSYGERCAYLSMRIHPATGRDTVDHFIPKTADWRLVYEWSNYRLCSHFVNTKKGTSILPFDPFSIPDGMVALELVAFQVVPGPAAAGAVETVVEEMINRTLGLNARQCRNLREEYCTRYWAGLTALQVLEEDAPFIAHELRRQGRLNP